MSKIKLKDGTISTDPRLGRVRQFDEKSRKFPLRAVVPKLPPRSYSWRMQKMLDQGNRPACVGFSQSHKLISRYNEQLGADDAFAYALYRRAQEVDEWPGSNYPGTSNLAGAKTLVAMGIAESYYWAFTLEEIILTLGYKGGLVFGSWWTSDMFNPDAKGFIKPTGTDQGGHAYFGNQIKIIKTNSKPISWDNIDYDKSWVGIAQTWGLRWGLNGYAKITLSDLWKLLQRDGESLFITESKKGVL